MRRTRVILAVTALVAGTVVLVNAPSAAAEPAAQCSPLVGISVRGFQETWDNEKFASPTVLAVANKLHRPIELHHVRYDASQYNNEVQAEGVNHLTVYLNTTSRNCPNTKFVLVGYSQGALIVGNVLAQNKIDGSRILGAVLYGDPVFNGSKHFDRGTYPDDALFPYQARLHSYCRADDNVCQRGASGNGHVMYYEYIDNAANFLIDQIRTSA